MDDAIASSHRPLPVIHFNAFPGTGKLTIARILASFFQPSSLKVVHNHLLINPADAVLHREQAGYQHLRQQIRLAIFHSLIHAPATHSAAYIFTDFQTSNELGAAVCQEYVECAKTRGCDFIPIMLSCDEETNLTRLVEDGRAGHGKLVDVDLVKRFRASQLYEFDDHPALLRLDVSELSADDAARRITDHLLKMSPELARYVEAVVD
ncbi:hypothetical protein HDV62DRAFT_365804 [Trichoderma sp. SZMC 28011]